MSKPTKAKAKPQAVIELVHGYVETPNERLLKKIIPACVISGALHVAVSATILLVGKYLLPPVQAKQNLQEVAVAVEEKQEEPLNEDLTKETFALDSTEETSIDTTPREADITIDTKITTNEAIGDPSVTTDLKMDSLATLGNPSESMIDPGMNVEGPGAGLLGDGGLSGIALSNPTFGGRSAATRNKMVKAFGGSDGSELAVGRGLAWLAKQQRPDGSWEYDGAKSKDKTASTGMALLPFLAAGQTHKPGKENKYRATVTAGLEYLIRTQKSDGSFLSSSTMYSHAIAAVALCEAYGMTSDKSFLLRPAQAAINYIQLAQAKDGSWGYQPKREGDTSIVGWQIQALQSAKLCKDMTVNKIVLDKARSFLDSVASGSRKEKYGYSSPGARPSLTSVGLLCRYYMDGWGPTHPGMAAGVDYLANSTAKSGGGLPNKENYDLYYYYYATQVMHFYEGDMWYKTWNPKMRDMLIDMQNKDATQTSTFGSWDKDADWIGRSCGRVGTTCMALLILEVYYRHTPLYRRGTGGLRELERGK